MSLRDRLRANETFAVDDAVKRVLAKWAKERDSEVGRRNLESAVRRLNAEQRRQLTARLAEISLGLLYVLDRVSPDETPEKSDL